MNPLDLTREEARALLSPKRQYTDAEHTRAWYRFILGCAQDRLVEIMLDAKDNKITLEEVHSRLSDILYPESDEEYNEFDAWAIETVWNNFWNPENIRRIAEGEQHVGDCTAIPASCTRCYVDSLYGVDTVSWSGKHEGSALLRRAHPRD